MPGIFISYSSKNQKVAEQIFEELRRNGFTNLFLDRDPESGIPLSADWEKELYQKLRTTQGMIVLCSPDSMKSCWCFAEWTHARVGSLPIFSVVIADCTVDPILSRSQGIDLRTDRDAKMRQLMDAMRTSGLHRVQWNPNDPEATLFPGFRPFESRDEAILFGRDREISNGVSELERLRTGFHGQTRLLVVQGASGSGKSSLVRAGILPHLSEDHWVTVPPVELRRVGHQSPFEMFAGSLRACLAEHGVRGRESELRNLSVARMDALDSLLQEIRSAHRKSKGIGSGETAVLLVIDQMEQLLQRTESRERADESRRFLEFLVRALKRSGLFLAAVFPSDYTAEFEASPLGMLPRVVVAVSPVTRERFVEVILGPINVGKAAGLDIDIKETLVGKLIDATPSGDALPLLAFTLGKLWDLWIGRKRVGKLTLDDYRTIGEVEGALRDEAESALAEVPADRREEVRRAFLALASKDANGPTIGRPAPFPESTRELLGGFIRRRLLVRDGDYLRVAHDALFRNWPQLEKWLKDEEPFLAWLGRISNALEQYRANGQLLTHPALGEAGDHLRHANELGFALQPGVEELINRSTQSERARREKEIRQARRLRNAAIAAVVMLAAVVGALVIALGARRETRVEQNLRVATFGSPEEAIKALDSLADDLEGEDLVERVKGIDRSGGLEMLLVQAASTAKRRSDDAASIVHVVRSLTQAPLKKERAGALLAALDAGALFAPGYDGARARIVKLLRTDAVPHEEGCFEWLEVPAGSYRIGSGLDDEPIREETVSRFEITSRELSAECYARFNGGASAGPSGQATAVNWFEAYAFASWLGDLVWLPTEYEWEIAAGVLPAEPGHRHRLEGILDGIWEWCRNWYVRADAFDADRVRYKTIRGGSWFDGKLQSQLTYRHRRSPGRPLDHVGIRLVRYGSAEDWLGNYLVR